LNQLAVVAGIRALRVHDLRHSFASLCAQSGVPLLQIKSLLNHASLTTTQRYAHLTNNDLRIASQTVSDAVTNALKGEIYVSH
jgi:site-specific recombinase XerD